jgi:tetratricopeptide (TPR) repeat protein
MFVLLLSLSLSPLNSLSYAQAGPYDSGDAAFKNRGVPEQAHKALTLYREYFKKNPKDPEAGWRVAAGCYFVGMRLTQTQGEKSKLHTEGVEAAQAGIAADPKCGACYFWKAINLALLGQTKGSLKMFFTLGEIKENLKKSIEIDPAYMGAGAYRLQGQIEQELPGIVGGSNKKARAFYEKAIETAPEEPLNYIFMAKLLALEFDDLKAALEIAQRGIKAVPPNATQLEAVESIAELRHFLQEKKFLPSKL